MARLGSEDAKKYRFAALGTRSLSLAKWGFIAEGSIAVPFMAWSEIGVLDAPWYTKAVFTLL